MYGLAHICFALFACCLPYPYIRMSIACVCSCLRLISSHLMSSHLVSSHLMSSQLKPFIVKMRMRSYSVVFSKTRRSVLSFVADEMFCAARLLLFLNFLTNIPQNCNWRAHSNSRWKKSLHSTHKVCNRPPACLFEGIICLFFARCLSLILDRVREFGYVLYKFHL